MNFSRISSVVLAALFVTSLPAQPDRLRAGAATANVTPWLGLSVNGGLQDRRALYIHDELHARALVLDDGQTQLGIVVVDSCMIPRPVIDRAKERARVLTGIAPENLLISATHTHSAPTAHPSRQSIADEAYQRFLSVRIADAVHQAFHNREEAVIGWGAGAVPHQVFNRRWRMKPGTIPANPFGVVEQVRMNPPAGSPDLIEPAGPTDPGLSIVAVRRPDGSPLALLANYSLHYVGGTGPGHISADYFGAFAAEIGRLLKQDGSRAAATLGDRRSFVAILSNGTSGDINNINFRTPGERRPPYAKIEEVAQDVAREALRVYRGLQFRDSVQLGALHSELELRVRRPDARQLAWAKRTLMKAEGPQMEGAEEVWARENFFLSDYPQTVSIPLQTLRIGDLGIAAIPNEVFVETGLQLKAESPFPATFTIELANSYHGYLPTRKHHELGGYETWQSKSSHLEVDAEAKITARILELFRQLAAR